MCPSVSVCTGMQACVAGSLFSRGGRGFPKTHGFLCFPLLRHAALMGHCPQRLLGAALGSGS